MNPKAFMQAYKKLNIAQKKAVDAIDGPVMVVAGPGTGKTEVLALRIANILKKTDTHADGVLCLTFTNVGVSQMRDRLRKYIGSDSAKINVATFHSFGMSVVLDYYAVLDMDSPPKLINEMDSIAIFDTLLQSHKWEYLRPRSNNSKYYHDLKSMISFLKRERLSPDVFESNIKTEIKNLENRPENLSSRGPTKGELKREVVNTIEGLARTMEVVKFYRLYEELKSKENFFDYDDVLVNLVRVVEMSEDAVSSIKEKYLYVLIDEHQDSSGIQNEFLQKVWGGVEAPNIFVVGDDRQLIYGFGGASLAYFENFKDTYGKALLINLVDNYRSTQVIIDASHALLQSSLTKDKLKSNNKENHPLHLIEADYPRDEIIACGIEIKDQIARGIDPDHIAILVPKNRQIRSATQILIDMGIPVASDKSINLFDIPETQSFLRVLRIINEPLDSISISLSLFDNLSEIPPLLAHKFARENSLKSISLDFKTGNPQNLFEGKDPVSVWFDKLRSWLLASGSLSVYQLVQMVADEFLLKNVKNHDDLVRRVEVVRTFIHILLSQIEKNSKFTLKNFIDLLDRFESYGEHIPLTMFSADQGVKVLTLHGSKGMEFDFVWIAHMDEGSLMSSKKESFVLPANIKDKIKKKDEESAKRELYVAITRAKRFCRISYALHSYTGVDTNLASIITSLPDNIFNKITAKDTEKNILSHDPKLYVGESGSPAKYTSKMELANIVAEEYASRNISSTLLNNFFECPWKWYFRSLLQLPEQKTESLEFGDKVHKAIDLILKMDKKPNAKELLKIVKNDEEVLTVIDKWVGNRLPEISLRRENEQSVSRIDERFPHLNIYGKIDLIEILDKENLRVTDFKTGSAHKKSEIEKLDYEGRFSGLMRQLAMYSYLLTENQKWKKDVRESRLEFLMARNKNEYFYDTVIQPSHIDLLIRDIRDYDQLLKSGGWVNRECHFKPYGKSDAVCEYCILAKRIYK